MKKIFLTALACCFFLVPSAVRACSCLTSDPPFEFNRAKAVFIGRMLGGTEKFPATGEKNKPIELEAGDVRFTVEEIFKGNLAEEVTIGVESMRGTSCGDYGLERGKLYVVYAYAGAKDEKLLFTGVCTRTWAIDSDYAKEDLAFLRNLPPAGSGGNLEGRVWIDVKKTNAPSAEPLANIKVKITDANGRTTIVTTDRDGDFEIRRIKAGKYRVEPQLPPNYYLENAFRDVEVADRGTGAVGFEAYFTGEAAGRVVDKNGVGYNWIFLHFESADEADRRQIYGHSRGGNGAFGVRGVPPGEYVLSIELQGKDYSKNKKYYYPGTFKRAEATVVKIGLGGKVENLDFVLPAEFEVRSVEGRVFWRDGKPASDVEVLLLCGQSTRPDGFAIEFGPTEVQTDKDGKFRLEGFAGEVYWLQAVSRGEKGEFSSGARKIVLTENQKNLKIVLSDDGRPTGCGS